MNQPKWYAVPMVLYMQAHDYKLAQEFAKHNAAQCTSKLRSERFAPLTDKTTVVVTGDPMELDFIPDNT